MVDEASQTKSHVNTTKLYKLIDIKDFGYKYALNSMTGQTISPLNTDH